jgi:hypothetical protein
LSPPNLPLFRIRHTLPVSTVCYMS